jgi:hypothetical protein
MCRWRASPSPNCVHEVLARGIVAQISGVTLWRWLSTDALKPWRHRSWIFPRDPQFAEKAGRLLDLYANTWDGTALGPDEFVVSADAKPVLTTVFIVELLSLIEARGRTLFQIHVW